jgi:hypothetical protein
MRLRNRSALLFAAALLAPAAAQAQTPGALFAQFGFVGQFATVACGKPAGDGNILTTVSTERDGRVRWTENVGAGYQINTQEVLEARLTDSDNLAVRTNFFPGTQQPILQLLFIRRQDGKFRTVTNIVLQGPSLGEFRVVDGVVRATGRETPWRTPCR